MYGAVLGTGRAGASGVAYSFFSPDKGKLARQLVNCLREANQSVPEALETIAFANDRSNSGGKGRGKGNYGGKGRGFYGKGKGRFGKGRGKGKGMNFSITGANSVGVFGCGAVVICLSLASDPCRKRGSEQG